MANQDWWLLSVSSKMQNIQYFFQEETPIVTYSYNMILKVTSWWLHCLPKSNHFLFSCVLAFLFVLLTCYLISGWSIYQVCRSCECILDRVFYKQACSQRLCQTDKWILLGKASHYCQLKQLSIWLNLRRPRRINKAPLFGIFIQP